MNDNNSGNDGLMGFTNKWIIQFEFEGGFSVRISNNKIVVQGKMRFSNQKEPKEKNKPNVDARINTYVTR